MHSHTTSEHRNRIYYYYKCAGKHKKGSNFCTHSKNYRALETETRVWEVVSTILRNPAQLRDDIDAMIEEERSNKRGGPTREAETWLEKLAEIDNKRARYQEMTAERLITLDELRSRIAELEDTRAVAKRELENLRRHSERIAKLEKDRDTLLESFGRERT